MLLNNKNAVIYGAGPSLGGAVAKAFAADGAKVFVTHRRLDEAQKIVDEILSAGGKAEAAAVDAMDKNQIKLKTIFIPLCTQPAALIFHLTPSMYRMCRASL